mmetsp:Transcript_21924/g.55397  ORF Transcript_21924/g.55397 Transcript_21924/m.55397 type:complete len:138 (+) Transcript_21924:528-941(+)
MLTAKKKSDDKQRTLITKAKNAGLLEIQTWTDLIQSQDKEARRILRQSKGFVSAKQALLERGDRLLVEREQLELKVPDFASALLYTEDQDGDCAHEHFLVEGDGNMVKVEFPRALTRPPDKHRSGRPSCQKTGPWIR